MEIFDHMIEQKSALPFPEINTYSHTERLPCSLLMLKHTYIIRESSTLKHYELLD